MRPAKELQALALQDGSFTLEDEWWLAKAPFSKDFASEIIDRMDGHFTHWSQSGVGKTAWRAYQAYHSLSSDVGQTGYGLKFVGQDGELTTANVNHFRNLIRHQRVLVTSQRPAFEPMANNSDADSLNRVRMARTLLDYTMRQERIDARLETAIETALVLSTAYAITGWDPRVSASSPGRITCAIRTPCEVATEKVRDYAATSWWIVRDFESRWDIATRLAAEKPDDARKVIKQSFSEADYQFSTVGPDDAGFDPDQIPVYTLIAKPTRALPLGRRTRVCGEGIVIEDGPYPYPYPLIHRCAPAEFLGTSVACADSWDLLVVQEAYNAVMALAMTRMEAFGVPNVIAPEGSELGAQDFYGMNLLTYPPGLEKPSLLELLNIPGEIPKLLEMFKELGETLSGINSVSRGNPQENIKSGAMAALVQAMAVQFNSAQERAYTHLLEDVGSSIIKAYQTHVEPDTIIAIAGESDTGSVMTLKRESLQGIDRVTVKSVSSVAKTSAGRADMADKMLQYKMIRFPQEYETVLNTGVHIPVLGDATTEFASIQKENEMMQRGETPIVLDHDNHELHMAQHHYRIDAVARTDPEMRALFEQHMMQHYLKWRELSVKDPALLLAWGQKPLPIGGPPQGDVPGKPVSAPGAAKEVKKNEAKRQAEGPTGAGNAVPGRMPKEPEPAKTPDGESVV